MLTTSYNNNISASIDGENSMDGENSYYFLDVTYNNIL